MKYLLLKKRFDGVLKSPVECGLQGIVALGCSAMEGRARAWKSLKEVVECR